MGDIAQGQQVSKKLPAKQLIPYVLLVVGAVAMAVSFFLPFASAKGDYAEYLKQYGDRVYTAEAGLHNKDVVGLSLLTFLRIYIAGLQSGKLLGGMSWKLSYALRSWWSSRCLRCLFCCSEC